MLRRLGLQIIACSRSLATRPSNKAASLFKNNGCASALTTELAILPVSNSRSRARLFASSVLRLNVNMDPEKRRSSIARYLKLGSDKLNATKLPEALAAYQMVLQYDDLHLHAHQQCGLILHQLGRNLEATKHLKTAITLDSQDPETFLLFARVLMALDQRDAAYDHMKKAAKVDVDNLMAHKMMAEFEIKIGRFDHALRNLRVAAKLNPNDVDVLIQTGLVELERHNIDAAHALLAKAAQQPLPGAHRALSRWYSAQGDYARAVESLKRAQELSPDDNETDLALAGVYMKSGDKINARKHLEAILSRQANNVDALYMLAKLSLAEANYSTVQELCTKILNINIKFTAAYQLAGIGYLKQTSESDDKKLIKEALKYLRLAEIAEPKDLHTTALLAVTLEKQEEWQPLVKKLLDASRGLNKAVDALNRDLGEKKWINILFERLIRTDPSQENYIKTTVK